MIIKAQNAVCQKKVRVFILTFYLVTSFLQRAIIVNWISSFKLVHLCLIMMLPLFAMYKSTIKISKTVWAVVGALYLQTGIAYCIFGANKWILNMLFCTATVFTVWWMSDDFTLEDWLKVGKISGAFLLLFIFFNVLKNRNGIWIFFCNAFAGGHPVYTAVIGEGVNYDASWLGLFSFLAAGSFWWLPIFVGALVFSIITTSRAGFLICFAFTVWSVAQWIRKKLGKDTKILFWNDWNKKQRIFNLAITVFFLLIPICLDLAATSVQNTESSIQENVMIVLEERFTSIGDSEELGSAGRINMWKWVPKECRENIWGYGLGNGILNVKENDPVTIWEPHLHNIYLQVLLDQGILGLFVLLFLLFFFVRNEISSLFSNPISAFLLCYFFFGMLDGRFLDIMMWFFVGAYMSIRSKK